MCRCLRFTFKSRILDVNFGHTLDVNKLSTSVDMSFKWPGIVQKERPFFSDSYSNCGSWAPARLNVGKPAIRPCTTGKMLPTHQALLELTQAKLGSF